jgi:rubrerythrin
MESEKMVKSLVSLVQLDIDAVHAYDQAIEKIDVESIKARLEEFKADHMRHVDELSQCISRLGGKAPAFERDFKGFLIEGMTALRSVTGNEGALKAMKTNEGLTNSTYERALSWELPQDIKSIVQRNREDERRHIEFIESCLRDKLWDRAQEVA